MPRKTFADSDSDDEMIAAHKPSEPEGEVEEGDLVEESDDDLAPDDISFGESKAAALRRVQDAIEIIQGDKRKRKERRKERDEKFKQQKKLKLEALSKNRLPDDILEKLPSDPVTTQQKIPASEPDDVPAGASVTLNTEHQDPEADAYSGSDEDVEEFIALEKETVQAVYIKDQLKKRLQSVQTAADFKNQMLYGKHINRETMKSKLATGKKRRARLRR